MTTRMVPGFCVLVVLASLPAQRTWRVSCLGGPNIDYLDLPAAVAAAAPGDTIWVIWGPTNCPGNTSYSCTTTVNKPLTIIGVSSLGTPGLPDPLLTPTHGKLEITGLGQGERVIIANIGIGSVAPLLPYPAHGIHVHDCAGEVLLEGVWYQGSGFTNSVMRFERCSSVILRGCDLELSGEAVTLIDSTMLITNTWLYWSYPISIVPQVYWYTQTGPALWLRNSHATVIASLLDGPNGITSLSYPGYPAVWMESGILEIGPFSRLRGGYYAPGIRSAAYVAVTPALAQVRMDPRAQPLLANWGLGVQPIPTNIHATYHDYLVAGETYHVSVAGPPNGWGLMAIGSWATAPVQLPGLGMLALDQSSIAVLGIQQLDSIGWSEWTRQCPVNVPVGFPFAFQAAVLAPNGAISLAIPSPLSVAWPHGHIP